MPLVAGNAARVTIFSQLAEQAGLVIWHYRVLSSTNQGVELTETANALDAVYRPLWRAVLVTSASFRGIRCDKIDTQTGVVIESGRSTTTPADGLFAGEALPRQVSGIISWRTELAGRRNRGRSYLPFPSEGASDINTVPTATYIAGLNAIASERISDDAIVGVNGTATLRPTIGQRHEQHPTFTQVDIKTFLLPNRFATQRRRGSFGRPNIPF